jgi:acyl-CoA thioesterase-1
VVFSFGANDTALENSEVRVPTECTVANLQAVIDRTAALRLPMLIIVGPVPLNDERQRQRVLDLSPRLAAAAEARGIPFVDVAAAIDAHAIWREVVRRVRALTQRPAATLIWRASSPHRGSPGYKLRYSRPTASTR